MLTMEAEKPDTQAMEFANNYTKKGPSIFGLIIFPKYYWKISFQGYQYSTQILSSW